MQTIDKFKYSKKNLSFHFESVTTSNIYMQFLYTSNLLIENK
jgi:hypothetical protein